MPDSFAKLAKRPAGAEDDEIDDLVDERFSIAEEEKLLNESNGHKATANHLYANDRFSEAIGEYDKALAACPNYLDYEVAVLKSNIAICHIKLKEWKETVLAATKALKRLEKILPTTQRPENNGNRLELLRPENEGQVVELDDDDEEAEKTFQYLKLSDERKVRISSLRIKSFLRRARGNQEQGVWGNLAAAEEDYKALARMPNLTSYDLNIVRKQLASLPPQIEAAKTHEMGEMMGKLKELGNGILKPFGLSTDMFKMQQDEKTGGYNMSFGSSQ